MESQFEYYLRLLGQGYSRAQARRISGFTGEPPRTPTRTIWFLLGFSFGGLTFLAIHLMFL